MDASLLKAAQSNALSHVLHTFPAGGVAEQSGLQCGDQLLEVQGTSLQDMSRFDAWNVIKALPLEPITAVIRRRADAQ